MSDELLTNDVKNEILRRIMEEMVRKAKRLAPIDTGFLRAHIKGKVSGPDEITIFTEGVDYASYLEHGTKWIKIGTEELPRKLPNNTYLPFLKTAVYQTLPQIKAIIERTLTEVS